MTSSNQPLFTNLQCGDHIKVTNTTTTNMIAGNWTNLTVAAIQSALANMHLPSLDNQTMLNMTNSTTTGTKWNQRHMIGMSLAIGGNLLISVSLSVQKKAHNRLGQDSHWRYCLDKWWWLGMFLMVLGELGNFMAYGFAPASLVAPLGSVAVLANAFIAVVFLREPLTTPSLMGVTLVIVGSITLVSFSVKGKPPLSAGQIVEYLGAWTFLLYLGIEAVILAILLYFKYVRGNEHLVILLLLVGIIASITVIASKALSSLISESIFQGKQEILNAVFWVCLIILPITTGTQIKYLNRAMQLYDVSDVVPVNFIFFTVSAILAGAMFYKEFNGVAFDRVFMFLFGCILSFIGVYIIAHQDEYKTSLTEELRKRASTNDSGLASGSTSSSSARSDSFNSTDIVTMSDEEISASSDKLSSGVLSQGGNSERSSLVDFGRTATPSTSTATAKMLKDFVSTIKATETIHMVQPALSDNDETIP